MDIFVYQMVQNYKELYRFLSQKILTQHNQTPTVFVSYSSSAVLLIVSTCAHRLSLNTKVDLKKLRFFTIPHDSGSPLTTPVSKELVDIQRKVRCFFCFVLFFSLSIAELLHT